MSDQLQLGIVGLGRMGGDLALQCLDKGIYVVGHSVMPIPIYRHKASIRLVIM